MYLAVYRRVQKTLCVLVQVVSCAVAAYSWHPTLNLDELFDSLWAFALNVEALQLLPQLFMMAKVRGHSAIRTRFLGHVRHVLRPCAVSTVSVPRELYFFNSVSKKFLLQVVCVCKSGSGRSKFNS